eukprot:TRINITY_DN5273_c0_g1_i2.p1 TRINITY_DN5273_c0_g1~~TRINITY_DN5273_c0_g1_i2.p1  ORF type:complete len:810 (+),score=92.31 TRINITY_DN5273_c0_g1_i2:70-2499(+)
MGAEVSCGSDGCAQDCIRNKDDQRMMNHSDGSYSDADLAPGLSNMTDADIFKLLASVKVLQDVPESKLSSLINLALPNDFCPGQEIIRQFENAHELFIIMSGVVSVLVDDKQVAALHAGDYFGEQALLRYSSRKSTIVASTFVSTLKITSALFESLGLHRAFKMQPEHTVQAGTSEMKSLPPSNKTPAERKLISEALMSNPNITSLIGVESKLVERLVHAAWKQSVTSGTVVIQQGDIVADYLYVVQEGSFDVTLAPFDYTSEGHEMSCRRLSTGPVAETRAQRVASVAKGRVFGELALISSAARAATVTANADAVVWVIDRESFKDVMAKAYAEGATRYVTYFDKVKVFEALLDEEKRALAAAMTEMHFKRGETIIEQGEAGHLLFILIEGEAQVIKDGEPQGRLVATEEEAIVFGERALLKNEPRAATIRVVSEVARTLTLDRRSCDMLIGPLAELQDMPREARVPRPHGSIVLSDPGVELQRCGNIKRKDLKAVGLLGCGGFGAVHLVEHVVTKETYALKVMSKGYIVKCRMKHAVVQEKDIHLACDSPFIVKLFETYNGEQTLCLLLELALGGELFNIYAKKSFHGKTQHARFYAAAVISAFEHLHDKKIIYRDLKPENMLLDSAGYAKLTDMGLAKVVVGKTFTSCGTPDYLAPEMITCKGHTHAVDWWALGVFIYELMSGKPPFESKTPQQTFTNISAGYDNVKVSKVVKGPLNDLIRKLLHPNALERLPMLQGGSSRIKRHEWFKEFDWNAFDSLKMTPPYAPRLKSKRDLANFAPRESNRPPFRKYVDDKSGWDADFATST